MRLILIKCIPVLCESLALNHFIVTPTLNPFLRKAVMPGDVQFYVGHHLSLIVVIVFFLCLTRLGMYHWFKTAKPTELQDWKHFESCTLPACGMFPEAGFLA